MKTNAGASRKEEGIVPKKPAKPKQASGGSRLTAAGKRPVLLGLRPEDKELLDRAADKVGEYTTTFIIAAALAEARRVLGR